MFFDYFLTYYVHQGFGPTFIVTNVVCSFAIALLFNDVKWQWKSLLRLFLDALAVWLINVFLNCFMTYLGLFIPSSFNFGLFSRYTVWLFTALIHTAYPRHIPNYWLRLTFALLVASFILIGINISGTIGSFYTEAHGYPDSVFTDVTAYLVMALIIGVVFLFKALDLSQFHYLKRTPLLLLDFLILANYALMGAFDALFPANNAYKPVLYIGIFISDALAYAIFFINAKNYNEVIRSQAYALKLESEKQQLEISDSKYEELHKIRHDIKDQFALLSELLREKKYDEMQAYFADISEKVHVNIEFVDCGNDLLSAFCNMELAKAKEQAVEIQYKISVPKDLPIEATDLTSILTNLLDNAIEAEIRDQVADKPIVAEIKQEGNYLFIYIENAFDPAKHPEGILGLHTSKKDRGNHGYGTKIIKDLAMKNHGDVTYAVEGSLFKASLLLESQPSRKTR